MLRKGWHNKWLKVTHDSYTMSVAYQVCSTRQQASGIPSPEKIPGSTHNALWQVTVPLRIKLLPISLYRKASFLCQEKTAWTRVVSENWSMLLTI